MISFYKFILTECDGTLSWAELDHFDSPMQVFFSCKRICILASWLTFTLIIIWCDFGFCETHHNQTIDLIVNGCHKRSNSVSINYSVKKRAISVTYTEQLVHLKPHTFLMFFKLMTISLLSLYIILIFCICCETYNSNSKCLKLITQQFYWFSESTFVRSRRF